MASAAASANVASPKDRGTNQQRKRDPNERDPVEPRTPFHHTRKPQPRPVYPAEPVYPGGQVILTAVRDGAPRVMGVRVRAKPNAKLAIHKENAVGASPFPTFPDEPPERTRSNGTDEQGHADSAGPLTNRPKLSSPCHEQSVPNEKRPRHPPRPPLLCCFAQAACALWPPCSPTNPAEASNEKPAPERSKTMGTVQLL